MRAVCLAVILLMPLASFASPEQIYDSSPELDGYLSEEPGTNAYLGIDIADVTSDRLSPLKLKREAGVEVTMVDQDAPAGKAGLREHDVILTMNGTTIESGAQLRRMIHETPAGRIVTLGISRNGEPLTIKAQLAARGKFVSSSPAKSFHFDMPAMPVMPAMPEIDFPVSVVVVHSAMRSGLMVENLTPQLGDYFGTKEGHGVLVRSVEKGSHADKAGFRAGDVIVRVDKDEVHDTSDFSHSLRGHRSGGPLTIGIIRDKREQNLTLTLPEGKQSGELLGDEDVDSSDIETGIDMDELAAQISRVRPQMELAIQQAGRALEDLRKGLCQRNQWQRKQWRQQEQKLQKQMREQHLNLEKQWKLEQKEIQRELQHLQNTREI
ncbi:MAG: PDZ domain-containing protein [Acidobacteria bacterium]|nr:PDZ domain-containing protein [Acidobacteriota bacterium]